MKNDVNISILGRRPRVLVVEDDRDIREILDEYLVSFGCEVTLAVDGKDGLSKLESYEFDTVFCDIAMPTMSGTELLTKVRTRASEMPFVFVTGLGDPALIISAVRLGAADFIEKPFKREQIHRIARRVIAMEEKRQEIVATLKEAAAEGFGKYAERLGNLRVQLAMLKGIAEKQG